MSFRKHKYNLTIFSNILKKFFLETTFIIFILLIFCHTPFSLIILVINRQKLIYAIKHLMRSLNQLTIVIKTNNQGHV